MRIPSRALSMVALAVLVTTSCGDSTATTAVSATNDPGTTAAATTTPSTAPTTTTTAVPPTTTTAATTTTTTTTTTTIATTTTAPSAEASLLEFFAAAEGLDAEIAAAAVAFNGGVDMEVGTLTEDARATVLALGGLPYDLIPPGLALDLETAVLAVYADLDSRVAALQGAAWRLGTPGEPGNGEEAGLCLGLGSASKARFADDLAAARSLAAQRPEPPPLAADSVEAGTLAVRLDVISLVNYGCDSCGGAEYDEPIPVDWDAGLIDDGIEFEATFDGTRWQVMINAC